MLIQLQRGIKVNKEIDVPQQAKQLIGLMLKKYPGDRIGACKNQNETNFDIIKAHRYFKGINFQNIFQKKVYFLQQLKLQRNKQSFIKMSRKLTELNKQLNQPKQKIILSGRVDKKMFFGNHKSRHMILYNSGKLSYYDPQNGKFKGSITINENTKVYISDKKQHKKWILQTPNKIYQFRQLQHCAENWVQKINQFIKKE